MSLIISCRPTANELNASGTVPRQKPEPIGKVHSSSGSCVAYLGFKRMSPNPHLSCWPQPDEISSWNKVVWAPTIDLAAIRSRWRGLPFVHVCATALSLTPLDLSCGEKRAPAPAICTEPSMSSCRCSRARSTTIRDFRLWHETDMPTLFRNVRSQGQSRKHVLELSFSGFDPKAKWRVTR